MGFPGSWQVQGRNFPDASDSSHQCTICGKTFLVHGSLYKHKNIHKGMITLSHLPSSTKSNWQHETAYGIETWLVNITFKIMFASVISLFLESLWLVTKKSGKA